LADISILSRAVANYFDSDMYNSTYTVVYFDGKDDNLYLRLRAMSHTIYAAKFEQTGKLVTCTGASANEIILNR